MKASSESGLWALTISRESTDIIRGGVELILVYTRESRHPWWELEKPDKKGKGRSSDQRVTWDFIQPIIRNAHHAPSPKLAGVISDRCEPSRTTWSLAADEAAPIFVRFYMAPPAGPGWTSFDTASESMKPA